MQQCHARLEYLKEQDWKTNSSDILDKIHRAKFIEIVIFLEKHATRLLDPLFGDIQDPVFDKRT